MAQPRGNIWPMSPHLEIEDLRLFNPKRALSSYSLGTPRLLISWSVTTGRKTT